LLRENPTLFWNLVWWYAAVALPFETTALLHLASKPAAAAFIAAVDGPWGGMRVGDATTLTG
jgi:hypothetical protein